MPRTVDGRKKFEAIQMINNGLSQREIAKQTGLSRYYIKSLADDLGHQFPRKGIEEKGITCVCDFCQGFFRRSPSKVMRSQKNFCSNFCRGAYMVGEKNPNWSTGKSAKSFSTWILNQAGYRRWKEECLERAGNKCEVTGVTEKLHVHHIMPKASFKYAALDPDNGIVLSETAHIRVHALIREGFDFESAIDQLRKEYSENK